MTVTKFDERPGSDVSAPASSFSASRELFKLPAFVKDGKILDPSPNTTGNVTVDHPVVFDTQETPGVAPADGKRFMLFAGVHNPTVVGDDGIDLATSDNPVSGWSWVAGGWKLRDPSNQWALGEIIYDSVGQQLVAAYQYDLGADIRIHKATSNDGATWVQAGDWIISPKTGNLGYEMWRDKNVWGLRATLTGDNRAVAYVSNGDQSDGYDQQFLLTCEDLNSGEWFPLSLVGWDSPPILGAITYPVSTGDRFEAGHLCTINGVTYIFGNLLDGYVNKALGRVMAIPLDFDLINAIGPGQIIIGRGGGGDSDENGCHSPALLRVRDNVRDNLHVYYCGRDGTSTQNSIMVASADLTQ